MSCSLTIDLSDLVFIRKEYKSLSSIPTITLEHNAKWPSLGKANLFSGTIGLFYAEQGLALSAKTSLIFLENNFP